MGKGIGIIISSEHPRFDCEYKKTFSALGYDVKKYIMDFVPGHGFNDDEKKLIKDHMENARDFLRGCDAIIYARSYGAFFINGISYIRSFFDVPVIFSTESIIKNIKKYGNKIYTITPYAQKRHELEIKWLNHYGIRSMASLSLGRDDGYLKYIEPYDLNEAVKIANKSLNIDAIYIACTFMPGISGKNIIENDSKIPVISANGAILNDFLELNL
ncbi:hypothetical protein [Acidiplasma sp.]|uniref:hypothetical protein n=1 Tax=Acidiplasma sp. TaxID=1872114 RepID=UPI00258B7EC2|nr:hypothetical protein [Acidiplasma sp.]